MTLVECFIICKFKSCSLTYNLLKQNYFNGNKAPRLCHKYRITKYTYYISNFKDSIEYIMLIQIKRQQKLNSILKLGLVIQNSMNFYNKAAGIINVRATKKSDLYEGSNSIEIRENTSF